MFNFFKKKTPLPISVVQDREKEGATLFYYFRVGPEIWSLLDIFNQRPRNYNGRKNMGFVKNSDVKQLIIKLPHAGWIENRSIRNMDDIRKHCFGQNPILVSVNDVYSPEGDLIIRKILLTKDKGKPIYNVTELDKHGVRLEVVENAETSKLKYKPQDTYIPFGLRKTDRGHVLNELIFG